MSKAKCILCGCDDTFENEAFSDTVTACRDCGFGIERWVYKKITKLESDLATEREALRDICEVITRTIDDKVTMLTYKDRILFEKLEEQAETIIERLKGV